ncbi:MAG TPA: hypothetical protein VGQ31_08595 [Candidatus Limnocylindrales bacterium]|nr:hypothetical protein [Candidatus Limnocylindrales bacterium]
MVTKPSRAIAAVLLAAGGFVVGVTVLALALARILVDGGLPVRPADAAVLDDLIPMLPLIGAFAVVNVIAAVGLLLDRAWAAGLAVAAALVAVAIGATALILLALGADPLAPASTGRSSADGFGIVGLFTVLYLAVIVAVSTPGWSQRGSSGAAA